MSDEGGDTNGSGNLPLSWTGDVEWPDEETRVMLQDHDDLWQLDAVGRSRLAWLWLHGKLRSAYANLAELCDEYEHACRDRQRLEQHVQLQSLGSARVVGVTAAALATNASLVSAIAAQVVVVEEAAGLAETSLAAVLGPSAEHLLLFGDCPPQPSPREGVAGMPARGLLERLLECGVEHAALTTQHRMRPPLSRLLAPLHPAISDHPSTRALPGVPGIERNLFMVRHAKPEAIEMSSGSRCNPHEARFAANLAAYLVRQGVTPSSIALLTPYAGQVLTLRREMRAMNTRGAADVRTSTLRDFNGDESSIHPFARPLKPSSPSPSPSPSPASAAAPAADGRSTSPTLPTLPTALGANLGSDAAVANALSRARQGLYLIGNAENLAAASSLWGDSRGRTCEGGGRGAFLP